MHVVNFQSHHGLTADGIIGPQTAREAAAAGLPVHVTAATPTAAGLVDALAGLLGAAQSLP